MAMGCPMRQLPAARVAEPVHVSQGEVYVTQNPAECVGTVLGSCVSAVLWDAEAQVGGLNHLLLPPDPAQVDLSSDTLGAQVNLMELLINGILAAGGDRARLRAKVFGGAKMITGLSDAGARNAAFVTEFLADEGIPCEAQSLGGISARRLRTWPAYGRVLQRTLSGEANVEVASIEHTSKGGTGPNALSPHAEALRLSGVEIL